MEISLERPEFYCNEARFMDVHSAVQHQSGSQDEATAMNNARSWLECHIFAHCYSSQHKRHFIWVLLMQEGAAGWKRKLYAASQKSCITM